MSQPIIALCLDDIPGADAQFPNLDARARGFVCLIGREDDLGGPLSVIGDAPDEPDEGSVGDALADWADLEQYCDLFEPSYADLDAEPEYTFLVTAVPFDTVADALRDYPGVVLLRDVVKRDGRSFDPRALPALAAHGATPEDASGGDAPEPMRRIFAISWPDSPFTWWHWSGDDTRYDVRFARGEPIPDDYGIARTGDWLQLARTVNGAALLVVRQDDPDPADPVVYRIGVDDKEEQYAVRLATWVTMMREMIRDLPGNAAPPRVEA